MRLKEGVKILGISSEMLLGLLIINSICSELVITSVTDGKHKRKSQHNSGNAIDIRLPPPNEVEAVISKLIFALGDQFDVVLESDHIHIEYQP